MAEDLKGAACFFGGNVWEGGEAGDIDGGS
jgi:hypothetical protein